MDNVDKNVSQDDAEKLDENFAILDSEYQELGFFIDSTMMNERTGKVKLRKMEFRIQLTKVEIDMIRVGFKHNIEVSFTVSDTPIQLHIMGKDKIGFSLFDDVSCVWADIRFQDGHFKD